MHPASVLFFFFFFNDTATTEIYTLSLHDALPICAPFTGRRDEGGLDRRRRLLDPQHQIGEELVRALDLRGRERDRDRKSTRLNSSHDQISYAVFCLKKKTTAYVT